MWGNKIGWGISAAIVVGVIGIIALVVALDQPSAPTALAREPAVNSVQLPVNPASVVPVMTKDCDSADFYRKAIEQCLSQKDLYKEFADSNTPDLKKLPRFKAIDSVVGAADCKRMSLFSADPLTVVNYDTPHLPIYALELVGRTMNRAAMFLASDHPDQARRYFRAVFSLGAKMAAERVVSEELTTGLSLMEESAYGLRRMAETAGDKARQKQLSDFLVQTKQYREQHLKQLLFVISTLDRPTVYQHAGDIFAFAKGAGEKMWRIEAILKLGRQQYDIGTGGDQRYSRRLLHQLVNDPNEGPAIHQAAEQALELTPEKYRMLGAYSE